MVSAIATLSAKTGAATSAGNSRASFASAIAAAAPGGLSAATASSGINWLAVGSAKPLRMLGLLRSAGSLIATAAPSVATGRCNRLAARAGASSSTAGPAASAAISRSPAAPAVSAANTINGAAPVINTGVPRFNSAAARCTARSRNATASTARVRSARTFSALSRNGTWFIELPDLNSISLIFVAKIVQAMPVCRICPFFPRQQPCSYTLDLRDGCTPVHISRWYDQKWMAVNAS